MFNEDDVRALANIAMTKMILRPEYLKNDFLTSFNGREFDCFFSDGYGDPKYRTAFFCFKGSPNKFFGSIYSVSQGSYNPPTYFRLLTNLGRFTINTQDGYIFSGKAQSRIKRFKPFAMTYQTTSLACVK